jgi:AcrR family transcriptional regulator
MTQAERTDLSDRLMLDAAIKLIVERGVERTTLREVGENAGYSRGLAGHRFGNKSGLLEFIVRTVGEDWLTELKRGTRGVSGYKALAAAIDEHLKFCLEGFSSCADARSRPNGFSTTTLPCSAQPTLARCWATVSKSDGGIAR